MNLRMRLLSTTIAACSILSFQTKSRGLLYAAAEAVEIKCKDSNVLRDDRLSSGTKTSNNNPFHHYRFRKLRFYNRRSGGNGKINKLFTRRKRIRTPRLKKLPLSQQQQQQHEMEAKRTSQLLLSRARTAIAAATAASSSYRRQRGSRGNARFPTAPVVAPITSPVAPTTSPSVAPTTSPPVGPIFRFEKVGQRLCGSVPFGSFGFVVNLSDDGKRLATGSPYYPLSSDVMGLVRVYEQQDGQWSKIGQDIMGTNPPEMIQDGYASLSGDGNYVGYAPGDSSAGTFGFNQDAQLPEWTLSDSMSGFGTDFTSIRLSRNGSRIAVGKLDTVQLYQRGGSDTPLAEVSWQDPALDEPFMRVAISGDGNRVVMFHAFQMEARVYQYNEGTGMSMVGSPITNDAFFMTNSASLSHDGSVLVLGGSTYARAFEYDDSTSGTWEPKGSNILLTQDIDDRINDPMVSVSLSEGGDRLIASIVYFGEDTTAPTGRVTIYNFIDDEWTEIGSLLNTMANVAISPEGDYFAVGSFAKSADGMSQNGCVTAYQIVQT